MRYSKMAIIISQLWLIAGWMSNNPLMVIIGVAWILTAVMMDKKEFKTLSKKYGDKTKSTSDSQRKD